MRRPVATWAGRGQARSAALTLWWWTCPRRTGVAHGEHSAAPEAAAAQRCCCSWERDSSGSRHGRMRRRTTSWLPQSAAGVRPAGACARPAGRRPRGPRPDRRPCAEPVRHACVELGDPPDAEDAVGPVEDGAAAGPTARTSTRSPRATSVRRRLGRRDGDLARLHATGCRRSGMTVFPLRLCGLRRMRGHRPPAPRPGRRAGPGTPPRGGAAAPGSAFAAGLQPGQPLLLLIPVCSPTSVSVRPRRARTSRNRAPTCASEASTCTDSVMSAVDSGFPDPATDLASRRARPRRSHHDPPQNEELHMTSTRPASQPAHVPPPSKHQLALMIWLAVFPTLVTLNVTLGGWLRTLPTVPRTFVLATPRRTHRHLRRHAPPAPRPWTTAQPRCVSSCPLCPSRPGTRARHRTTRNRARRPGPSSLSSRGPRDDAAVVRERWSRARAGRSLGACSRRRTPPQCCAARRSSTRRRWSSTTCGTSRSCATPRARSACPRRPSSRPSPSGAPGCSRRSRRSRPTGGSGCPGRIAVEGRLALPPEVAAQRLEAWLCWQWFEAPPRQRTQWAPRPARWPPPRAADLDRGCDCRVGRPSCVHLPTAVAGPPRRRRQGVRSGLLTGMVGFRP